MESNNSIPHLFQNFVRELWDYLKVLFHRIINLRSDTDVAGTIADIKNGVVLEGSNLWILICSTIIACIGLDVNSPAVIIGAMLISPLMAPILGIGLSVGINDTDYIKKSLWNFMVAIGLSLVVSVVYFRLTPFGNFTAEMQARISPTILDAFVAFFGGLAGIIAGSRTNKTNAIPGVAIATALMPPLCTSGFGLAVGRWDIFGGAFYLFFINAVLISISTYSIVRVLKFPLVKTLDSRIALRAKRFAYLTLIILLIPSLIFLLNSLKRANLDGSLRSFIGTYIHEDLEEGVNFNYELKDDTVLNMKVYYFGRYIEPDTVRKFEQYLLTRLNDQLLTRLYNFKTVALKLTPTDAPPDKEKERLVREIADLGSKMIELEQKQREDIEDQQKIGLEKDLQIDSLKRVIRDSIPFKDLTVELKALYEEINSFYLNKMSYTDFDSVGVQSKYVAFIKWNKRKIGRSRRRAEERIKRYLGVKLGTVNVEIFSD